MATLRILSAGAAQAVTERIIEAFEREKACDVAAAFGAVGAMKARVVGGENVDVIVLTHTMIDELAAAGMIEPASCVDLGTVATGVAVRAGVRVPDVSDAARLRTTILASDVVVCPDPAIATAGKVVLELLQKLGIAAATDGRLRFFPNGYAAMRWLAESDAASALGITQATEILANKGVIYAGPLPHEHEAKTVYSAAVACAAAEPALARAFVSHYCDATGRAWLREAGYE
jgi:molybdate transport system substrate-binding protein